MHSLRTSPGRRPIALLLLLLLAPATGRAADPVASCQKTLGRAASSLVRKVMKVEQSCLERRTRGTLPGTTICADRGPSLTGISHAPTRAAILAAQAKTRTSIGRRCAVVDLFRAPPAGLGAAPTCASWEPACGLAVTDLASLMGCIECTHVSAAQALIATQYPGATEPVAPSPQAVLHVDGASGGDTASCGAAAQPCRSIQQAVNRAGSGDEIRVAEGTYTYDAGLDTLCTPYIGTTAVVCILNKELRIRGGFAAVDWTTPDAAVHPTVIDGEGRWRGVLVQRTAPQAPNASLEMEGFTVTRGRVQGAASGGDAATFAFAGGILADASRTVLRTLVVRDNEAVGGDTAAGHGGAAAGGGIALRAAPSGTSLTDVTFVNNRASGGSGPARGGLAVGGGLYTFQSAVTGRNLVFDSNLAVAGSSAGSGTSGGVLADAQGGGAAIQQGSTVSLENVLAVDNRASGGDAGTDAGGGFGGGLYAELATLTVGDAVLSRNVVTGGDAVHGGLGAGGGLMAQDAAVTVDRSRVLDNRATGGDGSGTRGAGGGGGVYLSRFSGAAASVLRNSIVAGNEADQGATGAPPGGGGGGLFLQGVDVTIEHATVAANRLGATAMQGSGLILLAGASGAVAAIRHSIIAEHTDPAGAAALHVQPGSTAQLTRGVFSGNGRDTNAGGAPGPAGTFTGLGTMLSFAAVDFVAPGPPAFDYHLALTSPAIDQASGSTMWLDVDGASRVGTPDIGADEAGV